MLDQLEMNRHDRFRDYVERKMGVTVYTNGIGRYQVGGMQYVRRAEKYKLSYYQDTERR